MIINDIYLNPETSSWNITQNNKILYSCKIEYIPNEQYKMGRDKQNGILHKKKRNKYWKHYVL